MEPGHEDREYRLPSRMIGSPSISPQWSPVMKTGNTSVSSSSGDQTVSPQWSPVMKTGNTRPEP